MYQALQTELSPASDRLGVDSEVGTLRRVMLHRPGFELLADDRQPSVADLRRVRRARREHDAYADALASRGVEVLYLNDLLVETLEIEEARREVIERTVEAAGLPPAARLRITDWLASLPPLGLASRLVAGVSAHEPGLGDRRVSRNARRGESRGFVLPPLPRHLLARSTSSWIFDRVAIGASAGPLRRRESIHIDAIYRHHPLFSASSHRPWSAGLGGPARLEGGDVLVLDERSVLIGIGGGTAAISAALIAERLFEADAADRVIIASPPLRPDPVVLGDAVAMLDRDALAIRPDFRHGVVVHSLRPGDGRPEVTLERDLHGAVAADVGIDSVSSAGAGTLAIAPGVVVAFEHELEANEALREMGIEVIGVPGVELADAGATARSLAAPISRDPLV